MPKSAKRRGSSILALESLSCPAYFGTTDGSKTLQKSIQTSCQVSISYQPVELYMTYQHGCEVYIPEPHVGPSEFPYPDLFQPKCHQGIGLHNLGYRIIASGDWGDREEVIGPNKLLVTQFSWQNLFGTPFHLEKNVFSVWSTNMAVVCKQQSASIGNHFNWLFHQKISINQPRDIPQQLPNNKACHQKDQCFPQSHTVKS